MVEVLNSARLESSDCDHPFSRSVSIIHLLKELFIMLKVYQQTL